MYTEVTKDGVLWKNAANFDLAQTLDCGQAFRWSETERGVWHGIALGHPLTLKQTENGILFCGCETDVFEKVWKPYFDLDRDYKAVIDTVSQNPVLKAAAAYGSGIRILRQDPWEALCSFIISQNNNIPRIKGILSRLCENFGTKCQNDYAFPEASRLAGLSVDDLAVLRCGFRAKYILDAANKVASGELQLSNLYDAPLDETRAALMTVYGVGPKVADCTLLFGLGRIEAFPTDVWIKRTMSLLFDGKLPDCAVQYAGIAQQYLFYYARSGNLPE